MSNQFKGQLHLFNEPEKVVEQRSDHHVKQASVLWIINIDGASRGNPGPSGVGIYIYNSIINTRFYQA